MFTVYIHLLYNLGMAEKMSPIKHIRTNIFGVDQDRFAAMLGTTQPTVSRWETGGAAVTDARKQQIRDAAAAQGKTIEMSWFFEIPSEAA